MTTKEEQACSEIRSFDARMKDILGKNPLRKSLMGKYGELLVASWFKKKGFDVSKVEGNLTSYDLIVNGQKIEVRSSELKRERAFPENIQAWGWKLQTRDRGEKPKKIKYDYIILAQLFENWEKYNLYVFSKNEIEIMRPTFFTGYQTVARAIYLFKNKLKEAQKYDKHKMITKECIKFNKNPKRYLLNLRVNKIFQMC